MSRSLSALNSAQISRQDIKPVIFFSGEFTSGVLRLSSGVESISWGGNSWAGGILQSIVLPQENTQIQAAGMTVTISGVPPESVSFALQQVKPRGIGEVYLGFLNDNNQVIASPELVFTGLLDVPTFNHSESDNTISITYENKMIDLTRVRELRYNHETQQALYPGDDGFEYVASLSQRKLVW